MKTIQPVDFRPSTDTCIVIPRANTLSKCEHLKKLRSFFRRHLCEGAERPPRKRPVLWTLESLVLAAQASKYFAGCSAEVIRNTLACAGLLPRFEDVETSGSIDEQDLKRYRRLRALAKSKRPTRYNVNVLVVLFEHAKHTVLTVNPDDAPWASRLLASPRAYIFVSAASSNGRTYLLVHKAGTTTPAAALLDLIAKLKRHVRRGDRPAKMLLHFKNLPQTLAEALGDAQVFDEHLTVFSYCDHPRYRELEIALGKDGARSEPSVTAAEGAFASEGAGDSS